MLRKTHSGNSREAELDHTELTPMVIKEPRLVYFYHFPPVYED